MKAVMAEKYIDREPIGSGAYGKVYRARIRDTGDYVAIKRIKLNPKEGVSPSSLREISLLKFVGRSPHIVCLLDVEETRDARGRLVLDLIFEHLDTDLKNCIDLYKRSGLTFGTSFIKSFMYQLCSGVAHCHAHGFIHRDLKPQNILIDKSKGRLKIADFGLCRTLTSIHRQGKYTPGMVTLWYRAPEVLLGAQDYSMAVDVWALGCVFIELCSLIAPFSCGTEVEQILSVFMFMGTPNEEVWPGVSRLSGWHIWPQFRARDLRELVPRLEPQGLDLLKRMMVYDPSKRISAMKATEHPYFSDLDKSQFNDA